MHYQKIGKLLDSKWDSLRKMITSIDETSIDENHVKSICISIIQEKYRICHGGSFVHAIMENDLDGVLSHGDRDCLRALKLFNYAKKYINYEL